MERRWYRSFDWTLVLAALFISIMGVIVIHSADLRDGNARSESIRQAVSIVVGLGIMALFSSIDYQRWQKWARNLYIINILGLIAVMHGGHSALGAQRWISLGPLGTFQPSEPAKLILAITTAALLARKPVSAPRDLLWPLAALAVPALLILRQPDLGTTLVIVTIFSAELFFAVADTTVFYLYAAGIAVAGAFTVGTSFVLKPFQRARLLVFLNPHADLEGAGYNLNQSKIAVGSGGFTGKGLTLGTQTQLNFVPEHSRDFIFTVVGEELGFIGAVILLMMYGLLLRRAFEAMVVVRDGFGALLASGLIAMIAFHIIVNIGMTIGIMPITGIPLPFMSYGGSAIITNFAAVGILLNMSLQRDRLVFEEPLARRRGAA